MASAGAVCSCPDTHRLVGRQGKQAQTSGCRLDRMESSDYDRLQSKSCLLLARLYVLCLACTVCNTFLQHWH